MAYWGYASSAATLAVAVLGPVLGTMADTKGYKKPIFTICMMTGVIGCAALALPRSWVLFLAVFVIARVGYSASLIFYDAMLSDVTEPERMDRYRLRDMPGAIWAAAFPLWPVWGWCWEAAPWESPWNRPWEARSCSMPPGGCW